MSRRKRTHCRRMNIAWSEIEQIAASVLHADPSAACFFATMRLQPSSALYRTRSGAITARLVWREGNISVAMTARNLRVAP